MRAVGVGLACWLWAASVWAQPPVCFPERTVMWSTVVLDADGVAFAGLRAGQVVRVVDDMVGSEGKHADVEVDGPVKLRGRVYREGLLVFARDEIPVLPDAVWLVKEAPLWILSGSDGHATVQRAEPHGSLPTFPAVTAGCSQLRGTPPRDLHEDPCHGAWHQSPSRANGTPVEFETPPDLELSGAQLLPAEPERTSFRLIAVHGERALLEYIDNIDEWVRVRAYASAEGMRPSDPTGGFGIGHLCCEGTTFFGLKRDTPERKLTRDAQFRATLKSPAVTGTLPKGGRVQILAAFHDDVLIAHESKLSGQKWTGVSVHGWVPADAVSGPKTLPVAIRGRLASPEGTPLVATEVDVLARVENGHWMHGRVLPDGTFEVPAVPASMIEIKATTQDRKLHGEFKPMSRSENLVLHLRPTQELRSTVTTEDGHPIPAATAELRTFAYESVEARADGHGAFVLRAPQSDRDVLYLRAHGFLAHRLRVRGELPATIALKRAVVLAGNVARDARGQCSEDELFTLAGQTVRVGPDCSFALLQQDLDVADINGRRIRDGGITISAKEGWSTSGGCSFGAGSGGAVASTSSHRCDVEGDSLDLCLHKQCTDKPRASVFVRVLAPTGALAPDSQVDAFEGDRRVGSCSAANGACFIHGLRHGARIQLRASQAGRTLRATTTTRATAVVEATLK